MALTRLLQFKRINLLQTSSWNPNPKKNNMGYLTWQCVCMVHI